MLAYLTDTSTTDVASPAHLQRAAGHFKAVRAARLDGGACFAWSATEPPTVGLSVVGDDGHTLRTVEHKANTVSLAVATAPNGLIIVGFPERGSIQLLVSRWAAGEKQMEWQGKPVSLNARALPESPVAVSVVDDRVVASWLDGGKSGEMADSYSCEAALRVLELGDSPAVVADRTGGKLRMPAWGAPRGCLAIETGLVQGKTAVGVSWTGYRVRLSDQKTVVGPKEMLIPIAPLPAEK